MQHQVASKFPNPSDTVPADVEKVVVAMRFETVIEVLRDESLRRAEASLDELAGPWIEDYALHC